MVDFLQREQEEVQDASRFVLTISFWLILYGSSFCRQRKVPGNGGFLAERARRSAGQEAS